RALPGNCPRAGSLAPIWRGRPGLRRRCCRSLPEPGGWGAWYRCTSPGACAPGRGRIGLRWRRRCRRSVEPWGLCSSIECGEIGVAPERGGITSEGEKHRQAFGEALEAVVATGLDTQCAGPVVGLGVAVVEGFVGCLQPDLETLRILRRRHLQFGQRGDMVRGQFPGFAAVEVLLRTQITVETLVRKYRRVDQQGLQLIARSEERRVG